MRVLQRRPSNLVDVWDDGRYLRVLAAGDALVAVEVTNRGTIDAPDVRFRLRNGETAASASVGAYLRRILGLDADPDGLQRLAHRRALRATITALRGMRPPRFATLFETFVHVIPFQQLSLEAGVATVSRLVQKFGRKLECDGRPYYTSPSPQAIAEARLGRLRACGLSSGKAGTLRNVARMVEAGTLEEELLAAMSTHEALRTLTDLPGIGPWSAALLLLRGLGRLDVFPPGDTGAARTLGPMLRLSPATPFDRVVERFGDQRGYLYLCGLGASLLARGLIQAAPSAPGLRKA